MTTIKLGKQPVTFLFEGASPTQDSASTPMAIQRLADERCVIMLGIDPSVPANTMGAAASIDIEARLSADAGWAVVHSCSIKTFFAASGWRHVSIVLTRSFPQMRAVFRNTSGVAELSGKTFDVAIQE